MNYYVYVLDTNLFLFLNEWDTLQGVYNQIRIIPCIKAKLFAIGAIVCESVIYKPNKKQTFFFEQQDFIENTLSKTLRGERGTTEIRTD